MENKEIVNTDGSRNWQANILLDNLKRLEQEIAALKAENARLKEELTTYGATGVCEVCSDKANKLADKYLGCLREIKAIAEKPKPFKDFSEIKTATEVEYDYAAICNELELRLHKVVELITKAESEGDDER